MIPRILLVLACLGACAWCEEPAPRPELAIKLKDGTCLVGWAVGGGLEFESDLGKHDLKWSEMMSLAIRESGAELNLTDASKLKGRLLSQKVVLRRGGRPDREIGFEKVTTLDVSMLQQASGREPVRVLASTVAFPACTGLAPGSDGRFAVADATTQVVSLLDGESLNVAGQIKLPSKPRCLGVSPDRSHYAVSCGTSVLWIDAAQGAIASTVDAGVNVLHLGVLEDSIVVASDTSRTVAISFVKNAVIAKGEFDLGRVLGFAGARKLATAHGVLNFDPGADGVKRPPIFLQRTDLHPRTVGNSFLGANGALLVSAEGGLYRVGRGTYATFLHIRDVGKNTAGLISEDGKTASLFTDDGKMVVVLLETGEEITRVTTGLNVWMALPARGGKAVCVLGLPAPVQNDKLPVEFFDKGGAMAQMKLIALEE